MKNKAIKIFLLLFCSGSLLVATGVSQEKNRFATLLANRNDSTSLIMNQLRCNYPVALLTESQQDVQATKIQDYPKKSNFKSDRFLLMTAALVSLNYAAYQPFKNAWWQEDRTKFHFYQGWRRDRGYLDFGWHDTLYGHVDKLGHYYSSRIMSEQFFYICRWIGFQESSSKIIAPFLSSFLMLEIEIYDGFFKNWGFSLADFTANELGAFSPLIKERIPFLQNFQLKFSYHPSHQPNKEPSFIKDYAGMTFWLSCNIHSWLPAKAKEVYPAWLNFALGYGVTKQARGDIELYLAPDIDWMKIPIGKSQAMLSIKRMLNYVHFPCITLKLAPERKFYPFYF
jgi:hypothetical protein